LTKTVKGKLEFSETSELYINIFMS
jgi:hypothetical protein